ncbi:MAG: hypothetical protein NVSMB3_15060 [Acidobacteriaceae bacterium]
MRHLSLAFALLASVAAPLAAHADTYSFVISTGSSSMGSPATTFLASGTLTGTPTSVTPPTLTLTSVTGSAQGYAFTGIVPLGMTSSFTYDNLLFTDPNARHVDANGVLLYLNSPIGTSIAHVYDNAGYHVDVFDPADPGDVTPFAIDSFTLIPSTSSVPEPSTLTLLATGALGLFSAARRKLAR